MNITPPGNPNAVPGQPPQQFGAQAAPQKAAPQKTAEKTVPSKRASRNLLVAGVTAVAVAGGAFFYVTGSAANEDLQYVVYVKASDMGQGQIAPLEPLSPDMLAVRAIPTELVESNTFAGLSEPEAWAQLRTYLGIAAGDDGADMFARYPIDPGTQLKRSFLSLESVLADTTGVPQLGPDERLLSIRARVGAAVAGKLRVGDKIDVFGMRTHSAENDESGISASFDGPIVSLVADAVEIVAIDLDERLVSARASEQAGAGANSPRADQLAVNDPLPGMYVLRVHKDLAPRLMLADGQMDLFLTYRGKDAEATDVLPMTIFDLVCTPPVHSEAFPTGAYPFTPNWCVEAEFISGEAADSSNPFAVDPSN